MEENVKPEINFFHEDSTEKDIELLLGPIEENDGPFIPFDDSCIMAHLMVKGGLFPSVSQARKNGWNKPIPKGYTQFPFGKKRLMVYVLNLFEGE